MNEFRYLEQYKRMLRWYQRFNNIGLGREHNMDSDNYKDEVYAFFISCYHLKDWIANDKESGISRDAVEQFVHGNEYLKIAGDICNGVKHLKLDKPKGATMGERYFSLSVGIGEPIVKVKYNINADDMIYDALVVATKSVELWKLFLSSHDKKFESNL